MKYLGIDYGEKRIGIAASDDSGAFAFARKTISNNAKTLETILNCIKEEGSKALVMGIPKTAPGTKNPIEDDIREFADKLQAESELPLYFQDEQFSSIEASRFAPNDKKDDAVSAAIILQRYLDAHPSVE